MTADWILSLLRPYDSWNEYRSGKRFDAAHALSLAVVGRVQELAIPDSPIKVALDPWADEELPEDTASDWKLVYVVAITSIAKSVPHENIAWFQSFSEDDAQSPEPRAVAGLLAAALTSLTGDFSTSDEIAEATLSSLTDSVDPVTRIALLNQVAWRQLCSGAHLRAQRSAAGSETQIVDLIGRGDGAYAQNALIRSVVDALRSSAENLNVVAVAMEQQELRSAEAVSHTSGWEEQDRRARASFDKFTVEIFNERVRDNALINRPEVWGASDEIALTARYLWLNSELYGHVDRSRRFSVLAGLLSLSRDREDEYCTDDALSLLRHSGDVKSLRDALRNIRSEGPLRVLRDQTQSSVERILVLPDDSVVSRSDLLMLEFGGELLERGTVDAVVRKLASIPYRPIARDLVGTFRASERLWSAMHALVPYTTDIDVVLSAALDAAMTRDPAVRNDLKAVVRLANWSAAAIAVRERWLAFAMQDGDDDDQGLARDVLVRLSMLGERRAQRRLIADINTGDALALGAGLLDVGHSVDLPLPSDALRVLRLRCVDRIASLRQEAASGSFGFGGIDVLVVAAEMSRQYSEYQCWPDVVAALGDPNVALAHKEGALNWFAHYYQSLPKTVIQGLSDVATGLVQGPSEHLLASSSAGPALRFLGIAGSQQNQKLVEDVFFTLSGSSDDLQRVEAARSAIAVTGLIPRQFVSGVLLQLARDRNLFVRVAAARRLAASISQEPGNQFDHKVGLIVEFLEADGLSRPMAALRGIQEVQEPLDRTIIDAVEPSLTKLARDGVTSEIRQVANSLLERVAG